MHVTRPYTSRQSPPAERPPTFLDPSQPGTKASPAYFTTFTDSKTTPFGKGNSGCMIYLLLSKQVSVQALLTRPTDPSSRASGAGWPRGNLTSGLPQNEGLKSPFTLLVPSKSCSGSRSSGSSERIGVAALRSARPTTCGLLYDLSRFVLPSCPAHQVVVDAL